MYVWYALCAHVCVGPLAGMYVCMCYICVYTRGRALGCVCDMHMCAHVCVGALAGMYVYMYVLCMCVHMYVGPLTGMYICICYACKGALGCVCVWCAYVCTCVRDTGLCVWRLEVDLGSFLHPLSTLFF